MGINVKTNVNVTKKTIQLDEQKYKQYVNNMRQNQNMGFALAGGMLAAFVGAGIWAYVSYLTHYRIGWMAMGVGYLVGIAVCKFGRGVDKIFGLAGALMALMGCTTGNMLTALLFVSADKHIPMMALFIGLPLDAYPKIMTATFQPMDVLFYALALRFGYRMSFHRLSKDEIQKLVKTDG